MNSNQKDQKFIPRRDFIYLCVILVIILIAVISYFLGDSSKAGENLNFGATAVSIVLAVVAIIMTIVDSAGQKENVFQMRKAAEHLSKSVEDEKVLIHEFSSELQKVVALKEELIVSIAETQDWRDSVLNQLKMMAEEKHGENVVTIDKLNKLFIDENEKLKNNRKPLSNSSLHGCNSRIMTQIGLMLIKSGGMNINDILVSERLRIFTKNEIMSTINYLRSNGTIVGTEDELRLGDNVSAV